MNMEFIVKADDKIYEISELVKSVSYEDKLNDGCSKLDFSYVDNDLKLRNGSVVCFKYNDADIFYGYVFKHSRNKNGEITVTAYDQLRYAKAKDTVAIDGDTVSFLVRKMCNYFKLRQGILDDSGYVLATGYYDDKTWLDIIYSAIDETLTNKGEWYVLRDEFGSVALRNIENLKLDLVLGDKSLAYDFEYEKSIDDDFYNVIKIQAEIKKEGDSGSNEKTESIPIVKGDEDSVAKYGFLQYFEKVQVENEAQANSKAEMLLKLYNHEVETLSLNCLGDTSVRAGTSFYASIGDIGVNKRLIVRSVTHDFMPVHTMSLEVAI